MRTSAEICIFLNSFAVMMNLVDPKPVPDLAAYPGGCVHSAQKTNFARVRRSLPNEIADNPQNLPPAVDPHGSNVEYPSDTNQENDVSSFAIGDQVSEFFSNHKEKDTQEIPQMKQTPEDTPGNLVKDSKLVQGDDLPTDEQLECYKQQNIDPPENVFEPQRPVLKLQDQRPFAEPFQNEYRKLSRPLVYKEKGKRVHGRVDDDSIITSLYSDSEQRHKTKDRKVVITQPNDELKVPDELHQASEASVFKPVGVRPEFPVYDEDIDFHPDPLQGILEDKYWLDPQVQEAGIRKYIDLANNMQPPRVEHMKREVSAVHEAKSVDSNEAFREADAVDSECPCREIVACKDCSKGKWGKKSNSSEIGGNENYGQRKLLSINSKKYDNAAELEEKEEYSEDSGEGIDEGSEIINERLSYTSNYFGRKLLSVEDEVDNGEYYVADEGTELTDYKIPEGKYGSYYVYDSLPKCGNEKNKIHNRRSISTDDESDNEEKTNLKYYSSPNMFKPSNNSIYEYKLEHENIGPENRNVKLKPMKELFDAQKQILDNNYDKAKYYKPNKLGNLLQKVIIKQRPKEASSTIDPDLEFQIVQNKTFENVSMAMNDINVSVTTEMANLVKNHKRREQPIFLGEGTKGRRSYQIPIVKHLNVKAFQGEDAGNGNVTSGSNNTTNISNNTTDSNANSTTGSSTNDTTDTSTTAYTTENSTLQSKTTKKKMESYDEDSFDAEIANDIVETVIAESQSGSVLGHNLGLWRRNDSVSKYAKVSPESEQLLKKVTECILDRIRDRLEGQSCTLLDDELLQFLKWMVLSGESYKEYLSRIHPELRDFKAAIHEEEFIGPPSRLNSAPRPKSPK